MGDLSRLGALEDEIFDLDEEDLEALLEDDYELGEVDYYDGVLDGIADDDDIDHPDLEDIYLTAVLLEDPDALEGMNGWFKKFKERRKAKKERRSQKKQKRRARKEARRERKERRQQRRAEKGELRLERARTRTKMKAEGGNFWDRIGGAVSNIGQGKLEEARAMAEEQLADMGIDASPERINEMVGEFTDNFGRSIGAGAAAESDVKTTLQKLTPWIIGGVSVAAIGTVVALAMKKKKGKK